ncbi:MAG: large-conductance mechanosensitive channel protein MscL [Candidatus Omnitrophica bacterium]|nr:large-conductance mechanosensitive channel protein MscL [Candidatus Omnitrophota bacterium]
MLKEFKAFAMRGNVIDMAVGIIIGASFGAIVNSLVADVMMPPVGLLLGRVDFSNLFVVLRPGVPPGPYASLGQAKSAGAVTINYGLFLNHIISFIIVAFATFFLVKTVNRLKKQEPPPPPATKECPFCFSVISLKAVRCPYCTSSFETQSPTRG